MPTRQADSKTLQPNRGSLVTSVQNGTGWLDLHRITMMFTIFIAYTQRRNVTTEGQAGHHALAPPLLAPSVVVCRDRRRHPCAMRWWKASRRSWGLHLHGHVFWGRYSCVMSSHDVEQLWSMQVPAPLDDLGLLNTARRRMTILKHDRLFADDYARGQC